MTSFATRYPDIVKKYKVDEDREVHNHNIIELKTKYGELLQIDR